VEQLWFSFKQREMRRVILNWYNALRAEWGLEQIGLEPEETGDLVLEDFRFREPEAEDMPLVQKLHQFCVAEYRKYAEAQGLGNLFAVFPDNPANNIEEESLRGRPCLIAETVGGDFAAHVSVIRKGNILYISSLEVRPEYRGLGIGEALLSRLMADLDRDSISDIFLDLPAGVEGFSRVLFRSAFKPYATRYCLRTRDALE
jgi:GNAT superfamily N-acetyltransferase